MQSRVFDLGAVRKNAVVTVFLQASANIRLMTKANFRAYKQKQFYKMLGGVALTPMFKLTIPSNGHWVVVVDVDGLTSPLLLTRVQVDVDVP
ncbi:DUF1883 domain-containing protein [Amycolatopsis sp. WQ 127309]|uniref:DUF1883 domain-containing protein n=1 Tax=Amycolatopsis sp. WQ 127309 TaxID=2932773 RepID=UPI001FF5A1CB|nr:DUF1883 domain-containing protein [Amycolatopsis sp. WQ 127309]UOZ03347.1 DUF1883 domain-containing protein [Amycolatopsis sp. WQ 127309]